MTETCLDDVKKKIPFWSWPQPHQYFPLTGFGRETRIKSFEGRASRAAASLDGVRGWEVPQWSPFARGLRPEVVEPDAYQPVCSRQGWQHEVSNGIEEEFRESLFPLMVPSRQALLSSQSGPGASAAFSVTPSSALTRIESHLFRVLLQRRLHLPLPLSNRICGCGRPIDSFGHHRAACGRTGRKLAHVWSRTCWSATWTWQCHKQAMPDVWRQLQTDCHSGEASNLQSTPLWCQHFEVAETPGEELRHETEWRCPRLEGTGSGLTPNWLALELGRVWWFWHWRLVVDGLQRPLTSRRRMEQAWRLRWTGLLACTVLRCLLVGSPWRSGRRRFCVTTALLACAVSVQCVVVREF